MASFDETRAQRPVRFFLAVTAYKLIWWPICAVLIPFVALGAFVDWLSWTAFPAIAKAAYPTISFLHGGAHLASRLIFGPVPDEQDQ